MQRERGKDCPQEHHKQDAQAAPQAERHPNETGSSTGVRNAQLRTESPDAYGGPPNHTLGAENDEPEDVTAQTLAGFTATRSALPSPFTSPASVACSP